MSGRKDGVIARRSDRKRAGDWSTTVPLRFGNDPILWACWLYYEERMTQGDIAETMGVSRASVNAYLAEARMLGIVDVRIELEKLRSLTVARALKEYFGLQDCLVIPGEGGDRSLIERLGSAGAQTLRQFLKSGDTIAVGWGRTLLAVAEVVQISGLQDVCVVQATGSTNTRQPYAPEACAARLAAAINARCIPISAPAVVSSSEVRDVFLKESLLGEQLSALARANRIIFGISSLRPNSTIHNSGFFDDPLLHDAYASAVGAVLGRFIDDRGEPVAGPLDARTIGISLNDLRGIEQRIAIAGGMDKVPAILAALRGRYINVLVTDAATGHGILSAEGQEHLLKRPTNSQQKEAIRKTTVKKLINEPANVVKEAIEGAVSEHTRYLKPVDSARRALIARDGPRPGKVGLVVGGGSGHEPCFLGYVGRGMADGVVIGNVFASPPPGPILDCTRAVNSGAGVLHIFGTYSGDIMNFEMAAEIAEAEGIPVRTIITTDDVASSRADDREGRRGVAGNRFVFKIAGAACDRMLPLDQCEALGRKANDRTFTMGIALEPNSMPETRRPSFLLGADEMEVGVGIHGEPGVTRQKLTSADEATDIMVDRILAEMNPRRGDRVALLVNSLGGTPLMELYIVSRRVRQRLHARGVDIYASWVGHYCTSLDMVGVSISMLHLDDQLTSLLDHPCDTPFFRVGYVGS